MIDLVKYQERNRAYNLSQTETGSPLKTLKGSVVKRSKFGVGKFIGGKYYCHRDFISQIVPSETIERLHTCNLKIPFEAHVVRYNPNNEEIAFVECPGFDTEREPVVGRIFSVSKSGRTKMTIYYNRIYHHKWLFVDNGYKGFDVEESWRWSKKWLSVLTRPADGSSLYSWKEELKEFELDK